MTPQARAELLAPTLEQVEAENRYPARYRVDSKPFAEFSGDDMRRAFIEGARWQQRLATPIAGRDEEKNLETTATSLFGGGATGDQKSVLREEALNLASELIEWHSAADGDIDNGNGHFRIVTLSDSEQHRLNLRAVLWGAANALRAAYSAPQQSGDVREALRLARDRLLLLMPAELPETDHPVATRYVLKKVSDAYDALSLPAQKEDGPKLVAWQWCAYEGDEQRTGWHHEGTTDHGDWLHLAEKHPHLYRVIRRPLFATPETAPDGVRDIIAERERQKQVEGWTAAHDDGHTRGELATAAGSYALVAGFPDSARLMWTGINRSGEKRPWPNWPWSPSCWKPKDRRSDLVRAGALIVAEIERLDRALAATTADKAGGVL